MTARRILPPPRALELRRVQALCFDLDGTLVDTDDAYVEWLAARFRPLARLIPPEAARRWARRLILASETPANFLLGTPDFLGLDNALGPLLDRRRVRPQDLARRFRLVPDVRRSLDRLDKRYPMAVISARELATVYAFLEAFELRPFFGCIAAARTVARTKPHPAPILWAAAQMGVLPQTCAMIGDTVVDVRAGRAAGAQTIAVLCGFGQRGELERAGADLILEGTGEVAEVFLGPGEQHEGSRG
ncbi:MAG: HAD family hydrolase [Anaerolineales bacterium]